MKIIHFNNYPFSKGGADRYFLNVIDSLNNSGIDVLAFSSKKDRNEIPSKYRLCEFNSSILTNSATNVKNILDFLFSTTTLKSLKENINTSENLIAHLHIFHGQISNSLIYFLKKNKIPIIYTTHDYKLICPNQSVLFNGKLCNKCKNGHFYNSIINKCYKNSFPRSTLMSIDNYILRFLKFQDYVDRFICVSNFQKKIMIQMGVPESKIMVLYNFVNQDFLVDNDNSNKEGYIFCSSRLDDGKGIGTLIQAFFDSELYKVTSLIISGEGSSIISLQKQASSLGLTEKVIFVGHQSSKNLVNFIRGSSIVINPSEMFETFGLTTLEAMSGRRAVIASNIGAIPEVIEDGVSGLLFSAGNISELSSAMITLYSNIKLRYQIENNAYERAKNVFSHDIHLERLKKLYQEVGEKHFGSTN